ncbi:hypothetical protein [Desulfogranum japonicum]|uniref:hypothetical protein n=1 Tax=Desulfogranum japonicum TaxID=231447 RepID=UPI00048FB446|nr:hypothetical protein [Desulfogranum japonicum]
MKNIHYIISGFISYFIAEAISMLQAYFTEIPPFDNTKFFAMIIIMLVMSFCTGMMGCLIGFLFKFFQRFVTGINMYFQGIIYFFVIGCMFSLSKGSQYIASLDFVIAQFYSVLSAVVFVFFLSYFSKKHLSKQSE